MKNIVKLNVKSIPEIREQTFDESILCLSPNLYSFLQSILWTSIVDYTWNWNSNLFLNMNVYF